MSKYKRKSNGSIISKILIVFLVIAAVSSFGALFSIDFDSGNNANTTTTTTKNEDRFSTIYLVPSKDWASDESGYAAWCFGSDGVPAPGHISGTYNDTVGAVEFKVPVGYTQLLFIDLNPGTVFEGNWDNVRAQTSDLTLPGDENVYYHQYANEWRSDATNTEPEIVETTEETIVYCKTTDSNYLNIYVFNTFTSEGMFIDCTECSVNGSDNTYRFRIPAGYTHCIFVKHSVEETSWDNVVSQTADLIIPSDNKTVYDYDAQSWSENATVEE